MNKPKRTAARDQTLPVRQPKKRVWVTPAFEQVALKNSLNGTGDFLPDDLVTFVS